jgi:uncharacterized protein YdeI (YjbR/CyaY-like superfamily)
MDKLMQANRQLYVKTRQEWRAWLVQNHAREKEIWLVFYKKNTGQPCVSYDDAVEEALCFGWIDSIVKRLDEEKYIQKFTPRKSAANWSASNRERAERMIREGKMTLAGMDKIEEAKQNGRWSGTSPAMRSSAMPEGFELSLAANPKARENFDKLAPSHKKQYIGWIASAKQSATRSRRAKEAVELLERNQKLGLK